MAKKSSKSRDVESYPEFIYKPIDLSKSYDRRTFVDAFDDFSDLGSYLEKLAEDPRNPDALSDLGGLLFKKPDFFTKVDDPLLARQNADVFYSQSVEAMAQYTKRNFDEFMKKYEDGDLEKYVMSVPLYNTTKEREQKGHNEFVDTLRSMKEIQKIAKDGDVGKMSGYVGEKIENAPRWLQELLASSMGNEKYTAEMFRAFAEHDQNKFFRMLKDEKGKTRRKFVEGVIRGSLEESYHQMGKEMNEKDKRDIWKKAIRPYYVTLAGLVHEKEKKKEKVEKDSKKEKRKAERRSLGMGV